MNLKTYREELKTSLIKNSADMTNIYLCYGNIVSESVLHVKCIMCKRLMHSACIKKVTPSLIETNYVCPLCKNYTQ